MGERDRPGWFTLLVADPVDGPTQKPGHEDLRRVWRAAQQDGRRVTDAAFELTGDPARFGQCTASCRLTRQELAVVSQEQHGWHRRRPATQRERLDHAITLCRRRRVRRAEVDPQAIRHPASLDLAP
jgi:hypothetical protein